MEVYEQESSVHFGEVGEPINWRKGSIENDEDPDDEVLGKTPDDVIAVLGFDPAEGGFE